MFQPKRFGGPPSIKRIGANGAGYEPTDVSSMWKIFQQHQLSMGVAVAVAIILALIGNGLGLGALIWNGSQTNVAPLFIVVGQPTPGVESWPVTPVPTVRFPSIPTYPNNVHPGGTFPPPGAIPVNTFKEAMTLLEGKVVYNTTIFVHPGFYPEGMSISGIGNAGGRGRFAEDVTGRGEVYQSGGLTIVGDVRQITGMTYMHGGWTSGGFFNENPPNRIHPVLGCTFCVPQLSCTANTLTVSMLQQSAFYGDTPPDFVAAGIVAGDKIRLYSYANNLISDRTVVSVSANTVTFDGPSDCALMTGQDGDAITFMPNRKFQSQATSTAAYDGNYANSLLVSDPATIMGFHFQINPYPFNTYAAMKVDGRLNSVFNVFDCTGNNGTEPICFIVTGTIFSQLSGTAAFDFALIGSDPIDFVSGQPQNTFFSEGPNAIEFSGQVVNSAFLGAFAINMIHTGTGEGGDGRAVKLFSPMDYNVINVACPRCIRTVDISAGGDVNTFVVSVNGGSEACVFLRAHSTWMDFVGTMRLNAYGGDNCILLDDQGAYNVRNAAGFFGRLENCITGINARESSAVFLDSQPVRVGVTTDYAVADSAYFSIDQVVLRPGMSLIANGAIMADYRVQYLDGTSALAMTMAAPLTNYLNKVYIITSRTAYAHTITLSGGATWDGSNTVATFSGSDGDYISFLVGTTTRIYIQSSSGVAFS